MPHYIWQRNSQTQTPLATSRSKDDRGVGRLHGHERFRSETSSIQTNCKQKLRRFGVLSGLVQSNPRPHALLVRRPDESPLRTPCPAGPWQGDDYILWGQQKLRAFKQVQWEGLTWKAGDFQLEPFPGKIMHCCLSSTDIPFLLLQEYTIASKSRFSMVFRATGRVRKLQDMLRSKLASWWLIEETGLVRALR